MKNDSFARGLMMLLLLHC